MKILPLDQGIRRDREGEPLLRANVKKILFHLLLEKAIRLVLSSILFGTGDFGIWLQNSGPAMGSISSSIWAIIYMSSWEPKARSKCLTRQTFSPHSGSFTWMISL